MNGPHDMGGLQSFGPVVAEKDEPYFHHAWERRTLGLVVAMGGTGMWNLDMSRSARESLPPAQYVSSTYYQIWEAGLRKLLVMRGLVSAKELDEGRALAPPAPLKRTIGADDVAAALSRGGPTERPAPRPALFEPGDRVRTRNVHPSTHTRLPRYCRDKAGTIVRVHGAHVFPDSNALGKGEDPQWLYTVRFDAHELWGGDTTASAVHADLFEPYLEKA